MWKKIVTYIGIFFAGIITFFLGSKAFGRRVSGDSEGIGKIRDSFTEARDINRKSGEVTRDIKSDNTEARKGLRTALDILREAKERTDVEEG